jgi:predicted signal transduction protein with EAL and GGDEF domain
MPLGPELLKKLDGVLHKLQERTAVSRSANQRFALIHLVEGLSIADWQKLTQEYNVHGWLAVPLDEEEGVPLMALRETLKELAYQRDHDTLTGLANRHLFDRKLQFELERAYRTATPLSLVMVDIDHFKNVNDTHGHATGDRVLAALDNLLLNSLRIYDVAA